MKKLCINLDKLGEFFSASGTRPECPFCGCDDWIVPNAKITPGGVIPWGKGNGDTYANGVPVIVMFCKKCRFVRQHALLDGLEDVLEERHDDAT
ncbi:hypothetical protein [Pseudomonas nitroreducens]|uniref:hypothetical protein n=1 Tax=Pseudomonas nitroreducens TaxID=46680 RepID=UPI00351CD9E2